jgi:ribosomal protein S18 acetylase RimI-like enzyme
MAQTAPFSASERFRTTPLDPAQLNALQLRPAGLAELLETAAVITAAFHIHDHWLGWLSPLIKLGIHQDLRQRLLGQLANVAYPHYACLVAATPHPPTTRPPEISPEIIGTLELSLRTIPELGLGDQACPYLSNLAICPSYRRHGIAQKLLLQGEVTIRDWGFREIYLHVLENNHAALGLYRKLGYRVRQSHHPWGHYFWGQPRQLLMYKSLRA